jgi:hypothetical protein
MGDEGVELDKRIGVEEQLQPLTSRQLAACVLLRDARRPATKAGLFAHCV